MTDKVALWNRLRGDPDFKPEWLQFMGIVPPTEDEHRRWGDGGGDSRGHVIRDLSLADGYVLCTCGESMFVLGSIEDAWDSHRGRPDLVVERALNPVAPEALADDTEVEAFLTAVRNPEYAFS